MVYLQVEAPITTEVVAEEAVAAENDVETNNVESKEVETKPVETKPVETKPVASEPEEAENLRKIFTGGLNRETTDDEMKEYFGKFGEITDCVILKDSKNDSTFKYQTNLGNWGGGNWGGGYWGGGYWGGGYWGGGNWGLPGSCSFFFDKIPQF